MLTMALLCGLFLINNFTGIVSLERLIDLKSCTKIFLARLITVKVDRDSVRLE